MIKEVLAELEIKNHPLAKALFKNDTCKVLVIAFKKGMILKEHKANMASKLIVLNGKVIYIHEESKTTLGQYDEFEIPINQVHSVEAVEDSLCLLIQG